MSLPAKALIVSLAEPPKMMSLPLDATAIQAVRDRDVMLNRHALRRGRGHRQRPSLNISARSVPKQSGSLPALDR